MKNLSFSRQILPVIAIIGIVVAAIIIIRSQPDRSRDEPIIAPPVAPSDGAVVAGAGVIEPASELIEIGTNLPGVVQQVFVTPGESVTKGAPLFAIDSRAALAELRQAQASIGQLRASLKAADTAARTAQQQLALYKTVSDSRAVSQQEVIDRQGAFDTAVAQRDVARAQLGEAEARLAAARVTLDRLTVFAPISGQVLQVTARPGQYATAGPAPGNASSPLITMGQTSPLHVRIDIDENEIERADLGKAATISARGNASRRYRARFVRAEPLIIPKRSLTNSATERVDVRVLQLIFALEPDDNGLFVGQQVDAFVPAKATPAETRKSAGRTAS